MSVNSIGKWRQKTAPEKASENRVRIQCWEMAMITDLENSVGKMGSENDDEKWRQKNDVAKGHRKIASENGIRKQCWKTTLENDIGKWHCKTASQNGFGKHNKMVSENGIGKWLRKRGFYNTNL